MKGLVESLFLLCELPLATRSLTVPLLIRWGESFCSVLVSGGYLLAILRMTETQALLAAYVREHSDSAFGELGKAVH